MLERRIILGVTLAQLAALIGVSYQQVPKYERGLDRITAGRLYEAAQARGVPIGFFLEGLAGASPLPEVSSRQRMSLEIARNFAAISDRNLQEALNHLARALAARAPQAGRPEKPCVLPPPALPRE